MEHYFSAGRDLLPNIQKPAGAILCGSPSLKERQKSASLAAPLRRGITSGRPHPTGAFSPRITLLLGGARQKSFAGEAYIY
jgi:hypothetical protein